MTRKYIDLTLTLPCIDAIVPEHRQGGGQNLAVTAPDCDEDDLLQVIRSTYTALRRMEGNTRALELMVSDILFECHTFPDVAACARHIDQELSL